MANLFLRNDGRFIAVNSGDVSTSTSTNTNALFTTFYSTLTSTVALSNTGNFFSGPSIAQGSSGIWLVMGAAACLDSAGSAAMSARIFDGTTQWGGIIGFESPGVSLAGSMTISAIATSPSGNLILQCKDNSAITGWIYSGQITAIRIG